MVKWNILYIKNAVVARNLLYTDITEGGVIMTMAIESRETFPMDFCHIQRSIY